MPDATTAMASIDEATVAAVAAVNERLASMPWPAPFTLQLCDPLAAAQVQVTMRAPAGGWKVLLILAADAPPDVVIDCDAYEPLDAPFCPPLPSLSAWVNWRGLDGDSLFALVSELRAKHAAHQHAMVRELGGDRLAFELDMLSGERDLECFVARPPGSKEYAVTLRVPVAIDVDGQAVEVARVHADIALDGTSPSTLPPRRSEASAEVLARDAEWQWLHSVLLPRYRKESGVADFVAQVRQALQDAQKRRLVAQAQRTEFVRGIATAHQRHLVEYDAVAHRSITLLWAVDRTNYVATIRLPPGFPEARPDISLAETDETQLEGRVVNVDTQSFDPSGTPADWLAWLRRVLQRFCV